MILAIAVLLELTNVATKLIVERHYVATKVFIPPEYLKSWKARRHMVLHQKSWVSSVYVGSVAFQDNVVEIRWLQSLIIVCKAKL